MAGRTRGHLRALSASLLLAGALFAAAPGAAAEPVQAPAAPGAAGPAAECPRMSAAGNPAVPVHGCAYLTRDLAAGTPPAATGLLLPLLGILAAGAAWAGYRLLRAPGRRGHAPGWRRLWRTAHQEAARMVTGLRALPAQDSRLPALTPEAEAVMLVLDGDPDELDLVGAVVMARRVLRLVEGDAAGGDAAVCMVDPLHGPAAHRVRTRLADRRVRVCEDCLHRTEEERAAALLMVADPSGRRVAHLSLDRVWVHNNYRVPADHLLRRLRGESARP